MPKYNLPTIKKLPKNGFISISVAAKILGVNPDTLRNWERQGKISTQRTPGGARRYSLSELKILKTEIRPLKKTSAMLSISKAASLLQVSKDTLRNWEKKNLIESFRTKGGARRFSKQEISRLQKELGLSAALIASDITPALTQPQIKKTLNFWKIGSKVMYTALIFALFFALTPYLIPKKINEEDLRNVLGEQTGDLQAQIADLAEVLEDLQRSVNTLQSEPDSPPSYIYLPQTEFKIAGLVQGDLNPSVDNSFGLGSINSYFKHGFISNFSGKNITVETLKVGGVNILTGSEPPESSLGESGDYYLKKKDSESGLYLKVGSGWTSFNLPGLQKSYEVDNNLNALDGRDIKISLPDTMIDPNFNVNLAGDTSSFRINDDGTFADSSPFIVSANGNVGIGIGSPLSKLQVIDDSVATPVFIIQNDGSATPDLDILRLITNSGSPDNVVFRIDSEGDMFLDGSISASSTIITSGNADIAEEYNSLDSAGPGDIVVASGGVDVSLSREPYQKEILGVISIKPGFTLSLKEEGKLNPKAVALSGRVPVKVSLENGPIEPGDYLTSSSKPGVAMKAMKPGTVIGKALESFDGQGAGKILVFVNPSFADPDQILADLLLDEEGNLFIPKLKTDHLVFGRIDLAEDSVKFPSAESLELLSKLANLNSDSLFTQIENASNQKQLALLEEKLKDLEEAFNKLASQPKPEIADEKQTLEDLKLTPPDILLATDSAAVADSTSPEILSSEKLLTALDADISGVFKVFGEAFLPNTTIAGDLIVDGTFSISQNSLNSLNTLYLQNNPLAESIDIFNGVVTIDKAGNIRAETIIVANFKVVADKITGRNTIKKGEKTVEVENPLVEDTSKILITPTSETELVLAVTEKKEKSFTVSAPKMVESDTSFDWWMINEEKAENHGEKH